MGVLLLRASAAQLRIERARAWLAERSPGEEVLVVGASADAANELLRHAARERGAAFGWHRATPGRLAAELATPDLALAGLAPLGTLAAEAVAARAVHALREAGSLVRYAEVADGPGFARALAAALVELRFARIDDAALNAIAPELATLCAAYERELETARLADRARIWALAASAAADTSLRHPWLDRPTLLLDVPVASALELALVQALLARAPQALATVPVGDETSFERLCALPDAVVENLDDESDTSLRRLQRHLFEDVASAPRVLDDGVAVLSSPGESRECVEIARRVLRLAGEGVPFDAVAVLLRSADAYRPHLEEAFDRAGIPAHFARGAVHPHPAGRAFLALLACAGEGLSARRFAEYLSLAEVPDADPSGAPPPAVPAPDRWVAPDEEMVSDVVAAALAGPTASDDDPEAPSGASDGAPVAAGTLRAPRRWEQLLVDAAVIGGRDRWRRRLDGLERELQLDREALDDPDDPAAERIERSLEELGHLRAYALPLLDELEALPRRATWGAWLGPLSALASRALRRPDRVLAVLSELAPMAAVGPVGLAEVRLVLERRLLEVATPPPASRYGGVFVAPAESARGLAFDAVFVPGLAERLFPRKIQEEPLLLDPAREKLGGGLVVEKERIACERLALRIAAGAARRRIVLSYPRLDLDQRRPRVASFYALEALRAAEGALPGFDELRGRAENVTETRVGWPAPRRPDDAIDEAEHDLALLEVLLQQGEERSVGTARYLLTANPHLGRALRFRARRWLRRWTGADGLVRPAEGSRERIAEGALEAIGLHALAARSYSPTALQNFATCPYKFFLYALLKLAPREVPEAIEELDPLQRGSLVHDVQFELLGRLRDAQLLPVTRENLDAAAALLDDVLDGVAERYRDDLAPAIERVWEDGVASVRADLREWLRRSSQDASGLLPWGFELAFGLAGRRARDAHSTPEPVALDCGIQLRGSIDLVERAADGRLRVTDHKTGRDRVKAGAVVAGGTSLQPVFYALAAELLFPDATVEAGRLYYCTAAGGFEERIVALDERARAASQKVADVIGGALAEPFLPAAPAPGACRWCDYRRVCGPYEELRSSRKPEPELATLRALRELP